MFGYSTPVLVFVLGALASWGVALWWAYRQPKHRWYHIWTLGLVTLFWWLGESVAIRLGKYRYADFPLTLHLPGGGSPGNRSRLDNQLLALLPDPSRIPEKLNPACIATTWDIPLPIVALEAALLFGFFRLSVLLFKSARGYRLRAALATAGLCAFLIVNVFGVLDPVASRTMWCEPNQPDPHAAHLPIGLWTWFTTQEHQGYWYGVPLVNYAAWFMAAFSFAFVARLDDERPSGVIRKHTTVLLYTLATVVITVLYFVVLIPMKIVIDRVLLNGQEYLFSPHAIFPPRVWQFGVVGLLLAIGAWVASRGTRNKAARVDYVTVVPKVLTFLFCFGALVLYSHSGLWTVWAVTSAIALVALLWPRMSIMKHYLLSLWRRFLNRVFGPPQDPHSGEMREGERVG
jgi:hypothetical protein